MLCSCPNENFGLIVKEDLYNLTVSLTRSSLSARIISFKITILLCEVINC